MDVERDNGSTSDGAAAGSRVTDNIPYSERRNLIAVVIVSVLLLILGTQLGAVYLAVQAEHSRVANLSRLEAEVLTSRECLTDLLLVLPSDRQAMTPAELETLCPGVRSVLD